MPLIAVGSIYSKEDLENASHIGADLLAIGRELLIEPHWVEKIQRGEQVETALDTKNPPVLPTTMFEMIKSRPGWVPMK